MRLNVLREAMLLSLCCIGVNVALSNDGCNCCCKQVAV